MLYVAGNHEYYDGEFNAVQDGLAAAAGRTGVRLLDCTEHEGRRHPLPGLHALDGLQPRARRPAPARDRELAHEEPGLRRDPLRQAQVRAGGCDRPRARHRRWLEERLDEPFGGTTVVITHFAPHPLSIAPFYANHPANPSFVLDLEEMMGRAALWIHGHTHTRFDYRVRGTRVVCNPRGYPGEPTDFRPDWTIHLEGF